MMDLVCHLRYPVNIFTDDGGGGLYGDLWGQRVLD